MVDENSDMKKVDFLFGHCIRIPYFWSVIELWFFRFMYVQRKPLGCQRVYKNIIHKLFSGGFIAEKPIMKLDLINRINYIMDNPDNIPAYNYETVKIDLVCQAFGLWDL